MERASLRPVPQRPSGPVEPTEAIAHVTATLPALDEAAAEALALVELAGRTRPQLRAEMGMAPDEMSAALARARKALRRVSFPLPGSGWCERAEQLLSDELDGELVEPGARRLAAHLANCARCVEHERRYWQARDLLVAAFDEARAPAPAPEPPAVADEPDPEPVELPDPDPPALEPPPAAPLLGAAPELRLVEPPAAETVPPLTPEPADPIPSEPVPSEPTPAEPTPSAPTEPEPAEPVPTDPEPADPEPAEPAPAAEQPERAMAAAAEALPEPRSWTALAWTASLALAVLLAVLTIALTAYAIAGGGF